MDINAVRVAWEKWASAGSIPDDAEFDMLTKAYQTFVSLEEIFRPASMSRSTLDTLQRCNKARKERRP